MTPKPRPPKAMPATPMAKRASITPNDKRVLNHCAAKIERDLNMVDDGENPVTASANAKYYQEFREAVSTVLRHPYFEDVPNENPVGIFSVGDMKGHKHTFLQQDFLEAMKNTGLYEAACNFWHCSRCLGFAGWGCGIQVGSNMPGRKRLAGLMGSNLPTQVAELQADTRRDPDQLASGAEPDGALVWQGAFHLPGGRDGRGSQGYGCGCPSRRPREGLRAGDCPRLRLWCP